MKKITIFGLAVLAMAAVSCEINDYPTFDDADAFVSLPKTSFSIAEDGGKLLIPVNASSVSMPATKVSYKVVDGSAKQGTDYKLVETTGVLSFNEGEYTKNIEIEILPHSGVFTGDKTFSVILESATGFSLGKSVSASVKIQDNDHPLVELFGSYESEPLQDYDGYDAQFEWTIVKDASDVTKVWIEAFEPQAPAEDFNKVYGYVNEDMTLITVPSGQTCSGSFTSWGTDFSWWGYAGEDGEEDSDILIEINPQTKELTILTWIEFYIEAGQYSGSYYALYEPGITLKKL